MIHLVLNASNPVLFVQVFCDKQIPSCSRCKRLGLECCPRGEVINEDHRVQKMPSSFSSRKSTDSGVPHGHKRAFHMEIDNTDFSASSSPQLSIGEDMQDRRNTNTPRNAMISVDDSKDMRYWAQFMCNEFRRLKATGQIHDSRAVSLL